MSFFSLQIPASFIKSVQKLTSYARGSAKQAHAVRKGLHKAMEERAKSHPLDDTSRWKAYYLKHYCPTRWAGLFHSIESLDRNWVALQWLKANYIENGYGPTNQGGNMKCSRKGCQHRDGLKGGRDSNTCKLYCETCWPKQKKYGAFVPPHVAV